MASSSAGQSAIVHYTMFTALEVCLAADRSTEEEEAGVCVCVCSERGDVEDSCGLTADSLTSSLHLCKAAQRSAQQAVVFLFRA